MDSRKMKGSVCRPHVVLRLTGIVLIVVGVVLALFWPNIFDLLLARELALSPQAKSFEQWKKPSVPLYFDVYFFNWTNSEEFLDHSTKPILQEIGPYRFREIREKKNITFNDHNSTVSYRTISTFHFDVDGSVGQLDDEITQLNIVAVGASAQALNRDYQQRKLVSLGLNLYKQQLAITKTARELLFEGYEDDMAEMGRTGDLEGFDFKDIPYDKVGWFYLRNATDKLGGVYNVHTGKSDINKLGTIQNFNFLDHNKHYAGRCSRLSGSPGELFPPQKSQNSIELFAPDMCRSIPFDYESDQTINGVNGYRFVAGTRAVDNGMNFPDNACFSGGEDQIAFPSGLMNISACRYGSSVFMSYPHFFGADAVLSNEVIGLNPNKDKHESYFTLEPLTGAPLELAIRFQANFLVRPVEELAIFQEVPTVFMPAMWFEQKFAMDEDMARQIKTAVKIPWIGRAVGLILVALGIVLCVISSVIACVQAKRSSREQMEINLADRKLAPRVKKEVSPLLIRHSRPQVYRQRPTS